MTFRGVYIKLPEEAIELLDALAEHVGEVPPARRGRTSVILEMLKDAPGLSGSKARDAHRKLMKLLNPGGQ